MTKIDIYQDIIVTSTELVFPDVDTLYLGINNTKFHNKRTPNHEIMG